MCLIMATHSSTLAWKIPWMEEPSGLQSMGSQRVRYDWATSLSLFTFMHWRRKWQPAPLFLPGESQERGSLVGFPSMGSHRVGHYWIDAAAAAAAFCSALCSETQSLRFSCSCFRFLFALKCSLIQVNSIFLWGQEHNNDCLQHHPPSHYNRHNSKKPSLYKTELPK